MERNLRDESRVHRSRETRDRNVRRTGERAALGTRKVPLLPGTWHSVVWEIRGAERVAQLDDHPPLYLEDEALKAEKPRLVLLNDGQSAWFDDVKVWAAQPDDAWPERRAKLKQAGE